MASCERLGAVLAATALAGLLQGCPTPPKVSGVAPDVASRARALSDNPEHQRFARIALEYRAIVLDDKESRCDPKEGDTPVPAPFHRRCYVKIKVVPYLDTATNTQYCLAQLGREIRFTDRGTRKLVVFEIEKPSGSTVDYRFDEDDGIKLWTGNNSDIARAGRGNGDNQNKTPSQYHLRNMHGKQETAVYLPLILQYENTLAGDDKPQSVCGAADPTVINN